MDEQMTKDLLKIIEEHRKSIQLLYERIKQLEKKVRQLETYHKSF